MLVWCGANEIVVDVAGIGLLLVDIVQTYEGLIDAEFFSEIIAAGEESEVIDAKCVVELGTLGSGEDPCFPAPCILLACSGCADEVLALEPDVVTDKTALSGE